MKNKKLLDEFTEYCLSHPEERFWQALRNWSHESFICVTDTQPDKISNFLKDTFYFENRNE